MISAFGTARLTGDGRGCRCLQRRPPRLRALGSSLAVIYCCVHSNSVDAAPFGDFVLADFEARFQPNLSPRVGNSHDIHPSDYAAVIVVI